MRPLEADDFRSLVDRSPDPLAVVDAAGLLRYGSPALAEALGYTGEELAGRSALDFVHPEDLDGVRADVEASLAGLQPPPHDVRVRRKDGGFLTFDLVSRRFTDRAGAAATVFYARDVSLRTAGDAFLRYQSSHDVLTG
ncbi:MAG TPA: PAS domain S-box protein, partial [Vicinamibacteria bacterium]|nr:PAS domain S-box protein [Vicinamibacteria bacterium]